MDWRGLGRLRPADLIFAGASRQRVSSPSSQFIQIQISHSELQSSEGHRFELSTATNNRVEHETNVFDKRECNELSLKDLLRLKSFQKVCCQSVCSLFLSRNFSNWKNRMDEDVAVSPYFSQTQCKVNKRFLLTYCWEIAFRKLFLRVLSENAAAFVWASSLFLNCHLQVASLKRQSSSKCFSALKEFPF